jgi:predicted Zn-dependent protease
MKKQSGKKRYPFVREFVSVLSAVICLQLFVINAQAITITEEEKIAREFLKYVHQSYEIIDDSLINDYINSLGQSLVKNFPEQSIKYRFYVIHHDAFNAFAGPGGHVFIHSSLFDALENEEQLAGILAHEIAHVSCRHISDRIKRSKKIGMGTLAGVAAGIFLGLSGADPSAASALALGSLAGGQAASLAYSRSDEMQADQVGLDHLTKCGYSGEGLEEALKIIKSQQWFGPEHVPTYLTTHPALDDRMVFIKNWLFANEEKLKKEKKEQYGFNLAKMKLKILYNSNSDTLQTFKTNLDKNPDDLLLNYGYGLLLSKDGNYEKAIGYLRKALQKRAFDPVLLKEFGKVCFDAGHYVEAKSVFEGAHAVSPGDVEIDIYIGRILVELGEYDKALAVLLPYTNDENPHSSAFFYISSIYSKQGLTGESHYYLGQYYIEKKDYKNAVFHLNHAMKTTVNKERKDKIKEMLKDLSKEDVKEKADKKQ